MKTSLRLLAALSVATAAVGVSGCGAQLNTDLSAVSATVATSCPDKNTITYKTEYFGDVDGEYETSGLIGLFKASKLVVTGTVTAVQDRIPVPLDVGEPPESQSHYALVTVKPDHSIRGKAPEEIQFGMFSDFSPYAHISAPGQPVPAVGACGLWLLGQVADPSDRPHLFQLLGTGAELLFDSTGKVTNAGDEVHARPAVTDAAKLGTRANVLAALRKVS